MTLLWDEYIDLFVATINSVQNYGGENPDSLKLILIWIYIYTHTHTHTHTHRTRKTSSEMCQDNIQNTILCQICQNIQNKTFKLNVPYKQNTMLRRNVSWQTKDDLVLKSADTYIRTRSNEMCQNILNKTFKLNVPSTRNTILYWNMPIYT